MRITGGEHRSRVLVAPRGQETRPTSDRVREALFSMLTSDRVFGDAAPRVLDLYAGSGALGLEALSRGARSADFVEFRPSSLHALRANIASLRVRDRTRVFKRDALPFAGQLREGSYEIAFADPPYESRMLDRLIETWQRTPFAAVLAVEHARGHELPRADQRRTIEDTTLSIYRAPAPVERSAP